MTRTSFDLASITQSLSGTEGGVQLAAVAVALLVSWVIARAIRAKLPDDLEPGLAKIGAGSFGRVLFPLLFLGFAWLARIVLARYQPVPILHLAVLLIASFAAIRLAMYLLRHAFPPSEFLKSIERVVAFTVWVLAALYLTDLLPGILAALDAITLPVGKPSVSLKQAIEAVLLAAVALFVALALSGIFEKRLMRAESVNMSLRVVIAKALRALALVFGVLIALPLVGIDLTLLSVFGGAFGVGLGLGLQKIASNYVSGFIILLDRSVRIGDLVTADGKHGVVEAIRSRYTVIKGFDGTQAIVPNDTLITNTVVNHAYAERAVAVKILVTVSYDSNLDTAQRILLDAAARQPRVVAQPVATALVVGLGENGAALELTVYVADPEKGQANLRSDMLVDICREFRAQQIVIPAVQREIHVRNPTPISRVE